MLQINWLQVITATETLTINYFAWMLCKNNDTKANEETETRLKIATVFTVVEEFMFTRHLKLNQSKTVFRPVFKEKHTFHSSVMNNCSIAPSSQARNLGGF